MFLFCQRSCAGVGAATGVSEGPAQSVEGPLSHETGSGDREHLHGQEEAAHEFQVVGYILVSMEWMCPREMSSLQGALCTSFRRCVLNDSLLERCPHFRGCYVQVKMCPYQGALCTRCVPIREVSLFKGVLRTGFSGVGT